MEADLYSYFVEAKQSPCLPWNSQSESPTRPPRFSFVLSIIKATIVFSEQIILLEKGAARQGSGRGFGPLHTLRLFAVRRHF